MFTKLPMRVIGILALMAATAAAQPQTIAEIRQNHSSLQNQWVDVAGGIVTFKSTLGTRIVLQDPNDDEYAGIQIRDLNSVQNDTGGWLWNRVNVGDWVSFSNVRVTEWTGNTMLRFNDPDRPNDDFPLSTFTIESTGNPLPRPVRVGLGEILAPTYDGAFHIEPGALSDYQKLESMRLAVTDVEVAELDTGRFADNYVLRAQNDSGGGGASVFAADYNNYNRDVSNDYHPKVEVGAEFEYVVGYLERSKASSTPDDYYQLVTMTSASFSQTPGDFDYDGDTDGNDFLAWQRGESAGGPLNTDDLADWRSNYGASGGGTTSVPEPGAWTLSLGWLALWRRRRGAGLIVAGRWAWNASSLRIVDVSAFRS